MNPSRLIPLLVLLSIVPRMAHAADIIVMISGGFKSTYEALAPDFEKMTGSHLVLVPGPSEGSTEEAIPNRLARGEAADVLIMVGPALDKLVAQGDALGSSETELALSPIEMCVRAGTPVPDISTVDKFRQVLLNARSIAYFDSSSGVDISSTLFKKLRVQRQVQGKAHQIPGTPVAENRGARKGRNWVSGGCRNSSGPGGNVRRPHPGPGGIPDALRRGSGQPVQAPSASKAAHRISSLTDRAARAGENGTGASQEIVEAQCRLRCAGPGTLPRKSKNS
jgi:hypothetical protein